jgi:hypothetical protein
MDSSNSGEQCPWAGKAYGVACKLSAECGIDTDYVTGSTACALGACPIESGGLICQQSESSQSFKLCGPDAKQR